MPTSAAGAHLIFTPDAFAVFAKDPERDDPFGAELGGVMDIYHVIRRPLVTEKGTHQSKQAYAQTRTREGRGGAYSFEVHPGANKIEIRDAIEKIYNVRVADVRTSVHAGKPPAASIQGGVDAALEKAVVVLRPEFHIDLF